MKFEVEELPSAQRDIAGIFEWLHTRSSRGADAWLDAYERMLTRLRESADGFAGAVENDEFEFDVRQVLFKTKRGGPCRALFFIEGEKVCILRVRGPSQTPVDPDDL